MGRITSLRARLFWDDAPLGSLLTGRVAHVYHPSPFHSRVHASLDDLSEEDLEAQMEAFMRRQAEIESGESMRKAEPGKILGEAEVSEEEAKAYCREIVQVMKSLRQNRDMTVNEIKLTISIEDPRAREQRMMGIEDSRGVSRDEMADALTEVSEGRVPQDRIALRELRNEMVNWPFLELEGGEPSGVEKLAPATTPAEDDARADWRQKGEVRPPVGRGPDEKEGNVLTDMLGYGTLYVCSGSCNLSHPVTFTSSFSHVHPAISLNRYGISVAPAIIAGTVVLVLFLSSLK